MTPISENAIQFGDAQLSITFSFAADKMTWKIENQGGPATFQIDLASNAKGADLADGKTSIMVDKSQLDADGIDSIKHGFGTTLETKVGAKGTKVITFHASGKSR